MDILSTIFLVGLPNGQFQKYSKDDLIGHMNSAVSIEEIAILKKLK